MLFALSLGGYALTYWINVYLAHHLPISDFDDYNVAVSLVTVLSGLATMGLEKYALRIVSLYVERESWSRLRGFWRFSFRAIALFSLLLAGFLSLALESVLTLRHTDFHLAIVVYAAFLPLIALCLFMIEVITVYGAQLLALALYRFLLPILFIACLFALGRFNAPLTAIKTSLAHGLAWCLTFGLMLLAIRAVQPVALDKFQANSKGQRWWVHKSIPLLLSSLAMTILTSSGVIILEILHPSAVDVGAYAMTMQTCGLSSLIGTSTNRYYLPMLVVLLERGDWPGMQRLLGKRFRLIGGFTVVFLSVIAGWGREILSIFNEEFAQAYPALLIAAVGAAMNTLFADAPYCLQFIGHNRLVVGSLSFAVLSMIVLATILGEIYGATGIAIAYAVPVGLVLLSLKGLANRQLRRAISAQSPQPRHARS